jgi:hypothetical protein
MGLGILTSFAAAAEGVGGRSLNSGTEGGLEVKARPTGLLSWRFGNMAGVAMAESSASSLLLALLETLECMLPTGVRLRQPEAASAAGEGVIRGS